MAKNTSNSAFRKIDVDQYDEENYKEEDQSDPQSPPVGPDEVEINTLLSQGKHLDALKTVLRSAPVTSKNQCLKDNALNLVLRVLMSIKASQVEEAVRSLDKELIDILMKYIYRGFEFPSEKSSGHLLTWHEKTFTIGGVGSVMRVLTDRKRV